MNIIIQKKGQIALSSIFKFKVLVLYIYIYIHIYRYIYIYIFTILWRILRPTWLLDKTLANSKLKRTTIINSQLMLGIKCRRKIRFKYMLWFYYLGQVWPFQRQVGVCLTKQHVKNWGVRHILWGKNARKNLRVSLSGPSGPFFMLQQTWPIEWPLLGPVNDTLQLILFLPCFRFSKCVQIPTLHCFNIHQSTFAQ